MYEMTPLNSHHGSRPSAGRYDGRNICFRRIQNTKTSTVAQIFGRFHFIVQLSQFPLADTQPERKLAAAKSLLNTLSPTQRASVEAVAMDRRPAYISAATACLPQADIVHDRFHVSKYLGKAVDTVVNKNTVVCPKWAHLRLRAASMRGSRDMLMGVRPRLLRFGL